MKKGLTIISGGLDSTTATAIEKETIKIVLGITFDYGQKSSAKEIEAASYFCNKWSIEHRVIELDFLKSNSALTNSSKEIPSVQIDDLEKKKLTNEYAESVWVPNRNGIFINIAAGIAESENIDKLVLGFNKEEAETFPDNSTDFLERTNNALLLSTCGKVSAISPTIDMDKVDILNNANRLEIDLDKLWICYNGLDKWCGKCESCARFIRAAKTGCTIDKYRNLFIS